MDQDQDERVETPFDWSALDAAPLTRIDPRTLPLASRWDRLLGQIADKVIMFLLTVAGLALIFLLPGFLKFILGPLVGLWPTSYWFLSDGLEGGQSIGKRWIHTRVIAADTGESCSFKQSFLRNLTLTFLGPIDVLFIFGEKHQRLGDKLANTIVVETRDHQ
jgi:uncharacterized RDD family membrane protein YckC